MGRSLCFADCGGMVQGTWRRSVALMVALLLLATASLTLGSARLAGAAGAAGVQVVLGRVTRSDVQVKITPTTAPLQGAWISVLEEVGQNVAAAVGLTSVHHPLQVGKSYTASVHAMLPRGNVIQSVYSVVYAVYNSIAYIDIYVNVGAAGHGRTGPPPPPPKGASAPHGP